MQAILAAFFMIAAGGSIEAGQSGLLPRWTPIKDVGESILPGSDPRTVVLKLVDDAKAFTRNGKLKAHPHRPDVDAVVSFLANVPSLTVTRLVDIEDGLLERMRLQGQENIGQELADLSQLYSIRLPEGIEQRGLVATLLNFSAVESAYAAPLPSPPPGDIAPPITPDFTGQQAYRGPAPIGIDVDFATTQPGGRASGVQIADVEYSWQLDHEDLMVKGPSAPLGPAPVDPRNDTNHGTAVLGVLAADVDGFGVTGLAPDATVRVLAANTSDGLNVAGALLYTALQLNRGDVVLVEQQAFGPGGSLVPVEYNLAEYLAIRQLTACGIHVVEAGGNGGIDIDSLLQSRESGAVIVGSATAAAPHTRTVSSNFGERVDAFSWGESIVTLGYGPVGTGCASLFPGGDPDVRQWYTACFSGTSGASAIVASAVAILEAAHRAKWGQPMAPQAMRLLLRTTGTASADPMVDKIGRQPDLKEQLGIVQTVGPQVSLVATGRDYSRSGGSVASAGDIDGDGIEDVLIGAEGLNLAGVLGEAVIYSGKSGKLLGRVLGEMLGDRFGASVSGVGDVDGDGIPDVVVGAPNGLLDGTGYVHVISGQTGNLILRLTGNAPNSLFGATVAGLGDLNGDGSAEVAVGAPGFYSGIGQGIPGRVYIISGLTGAVLHELVADAGGFQLGISLSQAGDVDGDGIADIAIGEIRQSPSGQQPGRVYVYSGASWRSLHTFIGESVELGFGASVGGVADLDGDGRSEVIVGITGSFNALGDGRARVFSGLTGGRLFDFAGDALSAFGSSAAGVTDVNRDGFPDLAVGAPAWFGGGHGAVHVFSGVDGQQLNVFRGESAGSSFGRALADLSAGVLVGAPGYGSSSSGKSYLLLRTPAASPLLVLNGTPIFQGQVNFSVSGVPTSLAGKSGRVLLSWSGTKGRIMPGGEYVLPLTVDALTGWSLQFGSLFRGTVDGSGLMNTPSFQFPAVAAGLRIYCCAYFYDSAQKVLGVTHPISFVTQ
ncbi:MAG: FG-GAP-like repeat-containing protein [Planctomycetota bacterium]